MGARNPNATVYTDEAKAYIGLRSCMKLSGTASESTSAAMAHTNGMESFWSMLQRGYMGVYHQMSAQHLHRYVTEFSGRYNSRPLDTAAQMAKMVRGTVGKRLRYSGTPSRAAQSL